MEIKAIKFRKDAFYSQPFAFGAEDGPRNYDPQVRYRGSLQNCLIDTGLCCRQPKEKFNRA